MTDFKVGDRVRFTGWFHKDEEGEIISRAKMYDWKVRLDGGKSMTQSGTPVDSHEIELIEKKETPMTNIFKAGDKVRITTHSKAGNRWGNHPNITRAEKGTLATVTGVQYGMVSVEWFDGLTGGIIDFHPEELILVPQAYTFKKGDKVKLDPKRGPWFAPANIKHGALGTAATVIKVSPAPFTTTPETWVDLEYPDGLVSKSNKASNLILVQGDHVEGSEPLKETVAEIEAKIEKAVQDQARAKQDRKNAEAQRDAQQRAIEGAKKRDAEANKRIIEFGDQIVKLRELEKKKWRLEPGRTVQVKAGNFRFQNQYGTVDRVGGTNWVEVSGPFYDLYGKHYGFVIFRKEEVEVVR